MHLDLMTMAAVDITLTATLAAVLLFTWARDPREPEGGPRFVGRWGLTMLIQSIACGLDCRHVAYARRSESWRHPTAAGPDHMTRHARHR
jgi:hypothetical protein